MGCTSEEILVGGISHSNSFFLILAIKDIYYRKLLDMGQQDMDKLRQLSIDYLIVDLNVIFLDHRKEMEWRTYCKPQYPSQDTIYKRLQEGEKAEMSTKITHVRGNLPKELHSKLKCDLITGFLQKKSHILKWKHQFSVYCKDEEVLSGPVDGHFDFLEETGLIKIGKYDVLKDIFNWFNVKAIEEIDNASKEIEKALHDNNNKNEQLKAAGTNVKNSKGNDNNFIKKWKY